MPGCYVTGIAPTNDVSELERMLGDVGGVDRSKLHVITLADESSQHESSFLNFIHAGGGYVDSDMQGNLAGTDTDIITGSGGTGVPGIGMPVNRLGYLGTGDVENHFGTLPIPEDEAANYNDALDAGRTIVSYDCGDGDTAAVEGAFRSAGLQRVKRY